MERASGKVVEHQVRTISVASRARGGARTIFVNANPPLGERGGGGGDRDRERDSEMVTGTGTGTETEIVAQTELER